MNLHKELWQAFNDIYFEEETHKYTDSLGTVYQSATGWINHFVPEKDWDTIAANKAKKTGQKPEELRAQWKQSGNYAKTLGTAIHSVIENLWYKKDFKIDTSFEEQFPGIVDDFNYRKSRCIELFNKMKNIYAPVANEFIVYDQPNGICGTIDMLAYNMKNDTYAIIDWKTSKSFDTKGFRGETLLEPFSDIQCCNTSEYSIQLSLYKYMLTKKIPINITDLILFQIPDSNTPLMCVHRCFDFTDRIAKILK